MRYFFSNIAASTEKNKIDESMDVDDKVRNNLYVIKVRNNYM